MSRIARGATWSVAGTIASQVLAFATMVLAARALTPEMFGIVAMGAVAVTVLTPIRDLGLTPAIASGRITNDDTLWTAHWLVCAFGTALSGALFAASPLIARFFGTHEVTGVLRMQALTIGLGSAAAVPHAVMQRAGRFATLAGITALAQGLVFTGVAIGVALRAGIWALIVPGVVAPALMVPIYWHMVRPPSRLAFTPGKLRPLIQEGLHVSASSFCNIVIRNADNAIIGRISGGAALGLYSFSYSFLLQPLALFSHALIPVMLPAFGRLATPALRSDGTARTTLALLRLGTPFMIGGALVAPIFVPLIFGPRWAPAVPLVQILMGVGAIQIVGPVFGTLTLALGEARFFLRFGIAAAITAVLAFAMGAITAGPLGVAVGYLLHTLFFTGVMYVVARRRFHLPLGGVAAGIGRIGRDLALMTCAVMLVDAGASHVAASAVVRIAADVCAGAVAYSVAFRILSRDEVRLLLSLLPPTIGKVAARLFRVDLLRSSGRDDNATLPVNR